MNLVIFQSCINGTNLQYRLQNLLLILRNLFLTEVIMKISFLKLFRTKPTFRYHVMLKFQGLIHIYKETLEKADKLLQSVYAEAVNLAQEFCVEKKMITFIWTVDKVTFLLKQSRNTGKDQFTYRSFIFHLLKGKLVQVRK